MENFKREIYFLCLLSFLIFVNGNKEINLNENETDKQYIKKADVNSYTIKATYENGKKYLIDVMIFSGDIVLLYEDKKNKIHKYETANKVFLSILSDKDISEYVIQVQAMKSSYYSLRYVELKGNENEVGKINEIPINTNFLVTLNPLNSDGSYQSRKIKFKSDKPLLVNFYSLNCIHKIYKVIKDDSDNSEKSVLLKSTDDYFVQDINNKQNDNNEYSYHIEINSIELGKYNKKMCMIYTNSYEVDDKDLDKNILVGDNVPQKVKFNSNEFKKIKYLYQIPNKNNDIAIKFIFTERAKYDVNFYIDKIKKYKITISANHQEIIYSHDYFGQDGDSNKECNLIVEINLNSPSSGDKDLYLETTIKSISSIYKYPSYLIKNKINSEYLNSKSPNYYFTDIGQGISGEIIINYHRGNGMIFGKIVPKSEIYNENAEWKGVYDFPNKVQGSMKYNSFLKKLEFTELDTLECTNECYLLLNVVNVNSKYNNSVNDTLIEDQHEYFGFDILIITFSPSIVSSIYFPLIYLPLEKYVIGSISNNKISPDYIRYYIINIPSDAKKVILELQSDDAAMYINVYKRDDYYFIDNKYPTNINHCWNFYSKGKPRLFEIPYDDIIRKAAEISAIGDTNEGLSLTIAIETNNQNNDLSSIYALKSHIISSNLNINEVYSDQQTLCKTEVLYSPITHYRCLYIIKYNKNDINNHLLINPVLEDETRDYIMFANFIDRELYDLYKTTSLESSIPSVKNYAKMTDKEDFLYIDLNNKQEQYIFISIETERNINVKLLTTFSTFSYSVSPNPSTPQLYIIKDDLLKFTFINTDDFMINLVSILGGANIYWEDDEENKVYQIRGRDDRLSLTCPSVKQYYQDTKYLTLTIENRNITSHSDSQIPDAFIFYLTFYFRSSKNNLDKFNLGKSFNLNYRSTYFPLLFYFSLDDTAKDTNAFITIYNLESGTRDYIQEQEFDIYATILSDSSVYKLKSNPDLDIKKNSMMKGVYDSSKRVGLLSLKSHEFKNESIPENEGANLVIQISNRIHENDKNKLYSHISLEGTVIQDNSIIPVTEKVYQHGKLKNGSELIMYKLNVNKAQKIMYFVFSANSNLLDFNITSIYDADTNQIQDELNTNKFTSNGRIITYFNSKPENNYYLILTIYKIDPNQSNENLTNYVFKYINVEDINNIRLYSVDNPTISYTSQNNSHHLINIQPILCESCSITYYINFILKSSLIKNESFNNIALIQSKSITAEFDSNNIIPENNKINLSIVGINSQRDFSFIQVIAHINDQSINEYVAYNTVTYIPKNNSNSDTNKEQEKSNKTKLIIAVSVVGGVFLAVVIVLIVVIVKFNKKNKDLLNQVNSISFVDERNTINEDENTNNLIIN